MFDDTDDTATVEGLSGFAAMGLTVVRCCAAVALFTPPVVIDARVRWDSVRQGCRRAVCSRRAPL